MNNSYHTICKPIEKINLKERDEIVELYLSYYDGSNAGQVISDLNNKTDIILMIYKNKVVGFTTLELYERQWQKCPVRIVYSGDTIVAKEHWGQQSLTFACITRMGQYKQKKPDLPLYWFLIVKGHRTYKYLPVFVKIFYPYWGSQVDSLKKMAEFLARDKFGEVYNAQTGVLEFPESKGHLKEQYAYPNDNEKNKLSVNYFLKRNPGYLKGYELVCLCELSRENMKPLTRRVFEKGL
ncbi:MAG: hypothetical protein OQL19_19180 [Gammaproteobacteria bacterium]|nr:hypothetical protein [Gammaproteobacteria bacterium]